MFCDTGTPLCSKESGWSFPLYVRDRGRDRDRGHDRDCDCGRDLLRGWSVPIGLVWFDSVRIGFGLV